MTFRTLVMSAGNLHGVAFVGALKALEGQLRGVDRIVGCSAGAMIGAAIAVGYSVEELAGLLAHQLCVQGLPCLGLDALPNLLTRGSATDGEYMRAFFGSLLARKVDGGITFEELHDLRGVHLRIGVSNLDTGESQLLCKDSHPGMRVVDALMATTCIPLLFPAVVVDGHPCIDGGVFNHLPTDLVDGPVGEVLALCVDRCVKPKQVSTPLALAKQVVTAMLVEKYRRNRLIFPNTIVIQPVGPANMFGRVGLVRRVTKMPFEQFRGLVKAGAAAVAAHRLRIRPPAA